MRSPSHHNWLPTARAAAAARRRRDFSGLGVDVFVLATLVSFLNHAQMGFYRSAEPDTSASSSARRRDARRRCARRRGRRHPRRVDTPARPTTSSTPSGPRSSGSGSGSPANTDEAARARGADLHPLSECTGAGESFGTAAAAAAAAAVSSAAGTRPRPCAHAVDDAATRRSARRGAWRAWQRGGRHVSPGGALYYPLLTAAAVEHALLARHAAHAPLAGKQPSGRCRSECVGVPLCLLAASAVLVVGMLATLFIEHAGSAARTGPNAVRSYSIVTLSLQLANISKLTPYVVLVFLQLLFVITCCVLPILWNALSLALWLVPMRVGSLRSLLVAAETIYAWSTVDVLVVGIATRTQLISP